MLVSFVQWWWNDAITKPLAQFWAPLATSCQKHAEKSFGRRALASLVGACSNTFRHIIVSSLAFVSLLNVTFWGPQWRSLFDGCGVVSAATLQTFSIRSSAFCAYGKPQALMPVQMVFKNFVIFVDASSKRQGYPPYNVKSCNQPLATPGTQGMVKGPVT